MLKIIALAGALSVVLSSAPHAQTHGETLSMLKSYSECFAIRSNAEERLACYDAMLPKVAEMAKSAADQGSANNCAIEDWTFKREGKHTLINGATTCAAGRIDYRLYDGEKFLASGFTFIKGYAFQDYIELPKTPAEMSIKYSIE